MRSVLERRLLPGAPVWLVVIVVLAAATLIIDGVLTHTVLTHTGAAPPVSALPPINSASAGTGSATGSVAGLPSTTWVVLAALARATLFGATAWVMSWRARTADAEHAVWRWLARAAGLATAASLVSGALDIAYAFGAAIPAGVGAAVLGVGVLGACPLIYQGLIHWNRYGTLTSQPGDWLNGVGAVFALAALGNLLLPWLQSPLVHWPLWQTQLWLLRVAAEIMLLGTAATVLVIGALLSNVRAWALSIAIALVVVIDVSSARDLAAAAGDGPLSDAGWALVALVLVGSAGLRAEPPLPRPVTTPAPTAGPFVLLLASIRMLVL